MSNPLAPKAFRAKRKLFWLFAGVALVLDQLSKHFLWHAPGDGPPRTAIIPGLLNIVSHPGNTGGALGLPGNPLIYAIAAVVGLGLISYFFFTTDAAHGTTHAALGLLAGGAVGNLADRLMFGFVRDFIDLHWRDVYHWHTFNLADSAICVGVFIIACSALFCSGPAPDAEGNTDAPE